MCGIIGIFNHSEAISFAINGLLALQHRGQEAAGIAYFKEEGLESHIREGLVNQAFKKFSIPQNVFSALGHNRYSTAGEKSVSNGQPLTFNSKKGQIALVHNGTLTNHQQLRDYYLEKGSFFKSDGDSEVIAHLLVDPELNFDFKSPSLLFDRLEGAYSLILLLEDAMIGIRDPFGFRPLILGELEEGYIFASETTALDLLGAKYIREVNPGEIVLITKSGYKTVYQKEESKVAKCIFEYIYFSRPDSNLFNQTVYDVRLRLGQELAREHPVDADLVVPIPDSGNDSALGYSLEAEIPFGFGFVRNRYVGRTFIQPTDQLRKRDINTKLNPIKSVLKDKRVIIVDDSIVRGNTAKSRVRMVREAGAKEVHVRIPCPPITNPCYFGIDFPDQKDLIAANYNIAEICNVIEADSLEYLSLEGMLKAVSQGNTFCTACYSGNYPYDIKNIKKI